MFFWSPFCLFLFQPVSHAVSLKTSRGGRPASGTKDGAVKRKVQAGLGAGRVGGCRPWTEAAAPVKARSRIHMQVHSAGT